MLTFLLLIATFKSFSSANLLLTSTIGAHDPPTLTTVFGHKLPEYITPSHYRTSQDIILSCLLTIFASTWIAVHPNVPKPCTSGWQKFKDRITIMICALLAPELVTMWALSQRIGAARHMTEYNDKFHSGEIRQDRSLLRCTMEWFGRYDERWSHKHSRDSPWTLAHGFLLEMKGLLVNGSTVFYVTESRFWFNRRTRYQLRITELSRRVSLSEAEINDKNKGDLLTKLFVLFQTTWFITQVLVRCITRLPVAGLEVVTLGFIFLNTITYGLWWNKPRNMQVPIYVDTGEGHEVEGGGMHEARAREEMESSDLWKRILCAPFRIAKFIIMIPAKLFAMMTDHDIDSLFYSSYIDLMNTLSPMIVFIFGGLHFVPLWTTLFPSTLERRLWTVSTVSITIEPVLLLALALYERRSDRRWFTTATIVMALLAITSAWFYAAARVVLLVLSFTTLRAFQPSVYTGIE